MVGTSLEANQWSGKWQLAKIKENVTFPNIKLKVVTWVNVISKLIHSINKLFLFPFIIWFIFSFVIWFIWCKITNISLKNKSLFTIAFLFCLHLKHQHSFGHVSNYKRSQWFGPKKKSFDSAQQIKGGFKYTCVKIIGR